MARNRTAAAAVVVVVVVAAAAALAGGGRPTDPPEVDPSVLFLDEFEDGGLTVGDSPPGLWDGLDAVAGTDAGVSTAAARSGARGLRVWDFADLPAQGTTAAPYVDLGSDAGDRYARAWVRAVPTWDAGVFVTIQLLAGARAACDISLIFPPGTVVLAGDTANQGYQVTGTGFLLRNSWHLLECGLVDAGTSSVSRVLWIDAVERARQQISQDGWRVDELDVGEPWSDDGQFQGTVDVDGVAVTVTPPPSHAQVDAGPLDLQAGQCAPISARLMSSSKVPAGALRADRLFIAVDGGSAATFTDPDCADAGAFLDISPGTVDLAFGIQALAPSVLTVSLESTDLVGAPIDVNVVSPADAGLPDAGTDAGADGGEGGGDGGSEPGGDGGGEPGDGGQVGPLLDLSVCGCGSSGAPAGWLALAIIGLRGLARGSRRRRRGQAQAVFCTGAAAAPASEAR